MKWERITSGGRTVYWRCHLPDGSYLTVTRIDGRRPYGWAHRGPQFDRGHRDDPMYNRGAGYHVNASGSADTLREAKRLAELAAR